MPAATVMSALLDIRGVVKRFPGVTALRGVDLRLDAGEVLAVLGENGAERFLELSLTERQKKALDFFANRVKDSQRALAS